ncbi:MAG: phosphotransferase [Bryobacteraceae bacterium]
MIPQEKTAAVTRGLQEAFGVTEWEDIRRLTRGHTSALVFRIVVQGTPRLLRIIMRPNAAIGPERQFACMRSAADAGLAPRVWYTSTADQISITDFVEETSFSASEALVRLPAVLRTLHSLPPFPRVLTGFNTTCTFLLNDAAGSGAFFQRIQTANVFSKSASEELSACHARIAAVYPRPDREAINADMVSSHNDLFKPDNILFDGQRVWLVDWEAAFLNDRYADLAAVANLVVTNDAEETTYLREYFGQPPCEYQRARFFLMRQAAHLFYAAVFLMLGSPDVPVKPTDAAPEAIHFVRRMWAGEVDLAGKDARLAYGRIHWAQFVQNLAHPRLDQSLEIVADRHPSSIGN